MEANEEGAGPGELSVCGKVVRMAQGGGGRRLKQIGEGGQLVR